MKKFFKALSLLLALTLVIGVMPVAAAETVKPMESKILYIDGAKGSTEAGKTCKIKARVALWKLAGFESNAAYEDHTIKATVADETIAHAAKYYVYADAIGKTTVSLTVDGEKVGDVALQVKKNATEDSLTITGLEENGEYVVGGTYDVTLPRAGKDTDARALEIEGATVTAGEKARTWTVSFPKAGEYTVKYSAFQSKLFPKATQSKEFKVNVKFAEGVIAQTASDTFTITFPENVDLTGSVKAADFATTDIYYMIGVSEVPFSFVKSAKAEKNVVTVQMATSFTAKETYYVTFGGADYSFVGAGVDFADIAKVVITTTSVVGDTTTGYSADIEYKLYNAAGIEIAASVATPTFKTDSDDAIISGKTITFFETGKTATVTAEVNLNDAAEANDWTNTVITSDAVVITSADKAAAVYTGTMIYTFVAADTATYGDYSTNLTPVEFICAGETKQLQAWFQYSDGTSDPSYGKYTDMDFSKFEIADGNIALITKYENGCPVITAIAEGKTNLICYTGNATDGYVAALVIPVVVKAERKATTLTIAEQSSSYLSIGQNDITVKFNVKDQYGAAINSTLEFAQDTNNAKACAVSKGAITLISTGTTGEYKLTVPKNITATFASGDFSTARVIKLVVTDTVSKATANVSFSIKQADSSKVNVVLEADGDAISTALLAGDDFKDPGTVTISLKKYEGSYVAGTQEIEGVSGKVNAFLTAAPAQYDTTVTGDATGYAYYMTIDGKVVDGTNVTCPSQIALNAGEIVLDALDGNTKLAKGVYRFFVYKVVVDSEKTKYTLLGSKTVTVTDPQIKAVFEIKSSVAPASITTTGVETNVSAFTENFTWTFNGKETTNLTVNSYNVVYDSNGQLYVKSANVSVTLGSFTDTYDVTINKLLTK